MRALLAIALAPALLIAQPNEAGVRRAARQWLDRAQAAQESQRRFDIRAAYWYYSPQEWRQTVNWGLVQQSLTGEQWQPGHFWEVRGFPGLVPPATHVDQVFMLADRAYVVFRFERDRLFAVTFVYDEGWWKLRPHDYPGQRVREHPMLDDTLTAAQWAERVESATSLEKSQPPSNDLVGDFGYVEDVFPAREGCEVSVWSGGLSMQLECTLNPEEAIGLRRGEPIVFAGLPAEWNSPGTRTRDTRLKLVEVAVERDVTE